MALKISAYAIRLTSGLTAAGQNTVTIPYKPGDVQADFDPAAGSSLLLVNGRRLYRQDTDTFELTFGVSDITLTWRHFTDSIGDTDDLTLLTNIFSTHAPLSLADIAGLYQPLDSDLTAIAALSTTPFGRALLTLVDAAAGRTALSAEAAGTAAGLIAAHEGAADPHPTYTTAAELSAALANYLTVAAAASGYQPLDSDLTAIAALTTTAFGRSLLEAANGAAVRSAIGAQATGNYAVTDAANSWTANQTPKTATLVDGATVNWAATDGQSAYLSTSTARTIAAPTGLVNNQFYVLEINNGASVAHSFNSVFKWNGGSSNAPTAWSGRGIFTFKSDGTNLYEIGRSYPA